MKNYCAREDIQFNAEMSTYNFQKEQELAAMDPKKRPAPKKAEKLNWTRVLFSEALQFVCGNTTLLEAVNKIKSSESLLNEA